MLTSHPCLQRVRSQRRVKERGGGKGWCCNKLGEPVPRNHTAVVTMSFKSHQEVSISFSSRLINKWRKISVFCRCQELRPLFSSGGLSARRGALGSCGAGAAASPAVHSGTKPPGTTPSLPESGFLPVYVQRLGNSTLDTAVTDTAPGLLLRSRCWERDKLCSEADPGATCRPARLSQRSVKV